MARPPKYDTDAAKPVSVSLRIPRDLYDQAQHYAGRRRTTLTELFLDGLRLRLETPADPRDILVSQYNTVIQELELMIDARIYAILAAQALRAPVPAQLALTRVVEHGSNTDNYSNTIKAASHSTLQLAPREESPPSEACPPFDPAKNVLGKLCTQGHEWGTTGQTLRRLPNQSCRQCENESKRRKRAEKHQAAQA